MCSFRFDGDAGQLVGVFDRAGESIYNAASLPNTSALEYRCMHRSKLWRLNNEKWLTVGTRGLAELWDQVCSAHRPQRGSTPRTVHPCKEGDACFAHSHPEAKLKLIRLSVGDCDITKLIMYGEMHLSFARE